MKQPDIELSAQSDFQDWGVVEPEPERETQVEGSREFVDDRGASGDDGEQATLVADVDEGQQTLGGESAAGQSVW